MSWLRYVRLYGSFVRFSFSRAMEFRFDFYFRVLMDVVFYAVNLAFFKILFLHTLALGAWNLDQVIIFAAASMFCDALHMTLFANNLWVLPHMVNSGNLDYYLTRPVSSLYFLTFRDFAANSFLNLIIAGGILVWALARFPGELGAANIALFLAALGVGTGLNAMLNLIFIIPVFWMQGGSGLREVYWNLQVYGERPHQIYAPWLKRILVSVIPVALIASWPTLILFEGFSWARVLHFVLVVMCMYLFLLWFWNRALKSYASASS